MLGSEAGTSGNPMHAKGTSAGQSCRVHGPLRLSLSVVSDERRTVVARTCSVWTAQAPKVRIERASLLSTPLERYP